MGLGNVECSLVLGEELFCFFDAKDGDGEEESYLRKRRQEVVGGCGEQEACDGGEGESVFDDGSCSGGEGDEGLDGSVRGVVLEVEDKEGEDDNDQGGGQGGEVCEHDGGLEAEKR